MARRRPTQGPPAFRLILDSGAVIALSRRDDRARAALAAAWEVGADVSIPAVVVAETVRGSGPRDAPVNRVIAAVGEVGVADEATGRVAGALLGAAKSEATIDALVVADAIERGGGVILTADPDDLGRVAEGHTEVVIEAL
ncbi:MAG TPA: PIN domain-containing protein [Acidimicrobiia bacterium]|nr:PIN domain-containing protein [Acidimicrobiia bacterium]